MRPDPTRAPRPEPAALGDREGDRKERLPEDRQPPLGKSGRRWLGRAGEAAVAAHYGKLGFTLVANNLRTRYGELDLVVRRGRLLVAVEVKTRSDHPAPERLVDGRELERRATALRAVAPHLVPAVRLRLRVDVAAVCWPAAGTPEVRAFPGPELE